MEPQWAKDAQVPTRFCVARVFPSRERERPDGLDRSPVDLERYRDAEWALHDPEVQQHYQGQWVVAYERHILAHGPDAQAVVEQATRLVPGQAHRLVFCLPDEGVEWLQHTPDATVAFPDA